MSNPVSKFEFPKGDFLKEDLFFTGPLIKVKRSEYHLEELLKRLSRFAAESLHNLANAGAAETLAPDKQSQASPFDEDIPVIIGDVLHNLRSALDHGYNSCVRVHGNRVTNKTSLPFMETKEDFENRMKAAQKNGNSPSETVVQCLRSEIQPYRDGQLGLYGLNLLINWDKHKMLLPTNGEFRFEQLRLSNRKGGPGEVIINDARIIFDPRSEAPIIGQAGSSSAFPDELQYDGSEGAQFEIVFSKGQPFAGESVSAKLSELISGTALALSLMQDAMLNGLIAGGKIEYSVMMPSDGDVAGPTIRSQSVIPFLSYEQIWSQYDRVNMLRRVFIPSDQ